MYGRVVAAQEHAFRSALIAKRRWWSLALPSAWLGAPGALTGCGASVPYNSDLDRW